MKEKKDTTIAIRVSANDKKEIEEYASSLGLSVSTFARIAMKQYMSDDKGDK